MINFEIRSKVQTVGTKAGQVVYYAWPKDVQHMDTATVIEHIVEATSLTKGDVQNTITSLFNVIIEALKMGMSVDLAELGRLRVEVTSRQVDSPEEVNSSILKTPKIVFTPKSAMLAAAKEVKVSVDTSYVRSVSTGQVTDNSASGGGSAEDEGDGAG